MYQKNWFEVAYWKKMKCYTYFWPVCPKDLSSEGDLCLPVFLNRMCWASPGRSTCAGERKSGPASELFPVFSESAPLFFPSPSTHLSIDEAREAIRFVPWEQSMSEEPRGKKAREAGRNAVKDRELVWSPVHRNRWKHRDKQVWL